MGNKQTAVDWLVKELNLEGYDYTVQQAKQMEKEQIMDAYDSGEANHYRTNFIMDFVTDYNGDVSPEEFYNKTYGK